MSLIHWWPLNGDTQDKIGNKHGTILGTATLTESGKLGTCLSGGDGTQIAAGVNVANCNLLDEISDKYSAAMWIKVHGTHVHYEGAFISSGNWNNQRWTFGINQANNRIQPLTNASNQNYISLGKTLTTNQWYHVVTTYEDGKAYLYLDGELIGSVTATAPYQSSATNLCIGRETYAGGYFSFNGDICDVKIYDHALSQAEVKELSKALIVHYTFDDICAEPTTNIITGIKSAHGKSSLYDNGVKVDWSAGGSDSYFMFNYSQAIKANSVYTLSFDCEGLKSGEIATFAVSNLNPYTIVLQNGRNILTFTAGSDLMNDISTHNRLFFDDKTRTDGALFYLTNFQLEEKDHATPYTPSTRVSMLYNETGLTQPTYNTNINLIQDNSSGAFSLSCTGNTMINTPITGDITAGTTISCWIKVPTYPSANAIVFTDYNSKLAFGFYGTQNAIISCGGYSAPYISNIKSSWIDGWNHIVVTRNSSGTISCYLNGVKLSTTGSNNWSSTSGYSTIGGRYNGSYTTYFTGYVDDYRVYHTLLSDVDIQDLYKTKAYITDKNDMITHNYIENCEEIQVTNTYNAETRDIQEIGNEEYEQLEYIASTGTQYIDTGVYWTSEKATIVADLEVTTFKASSTIFGSEERYSGSSRYFAHILHAGSANGNYANYIGTGSRGATTSLTKDTRYVLEYIAHGDNTFSTKTTNNATGEVKVYNNKVSYTGTILTHQNSTQTAANRGHIYIFSNHNAYNGTGGIQTMGAMKLYRFTMIQDDIYIRDFIPCRRKSDSKAGLFDMVTGQFYTSPVGDFTAGDVITNEDTTVKFLSGGTIQARQFIEI